MSELYSKDEVFIRKLTELIHANIGNENFSVKEMAQGLGISRSGLNKRLHRLTRKSARQFIREIRLNKALEMLKNEVWTASEVAYKVGFSSPSYFNTSFHEFFDYPPGKVRTDIPGESYKEILNRESGKKEKLLSLLQSGKVRIAGLISIPVIIIMIFLIFQKISKKETLDDLWPSEGKISIAVMPFNNMTNDTSLDILQVWIQDEIISSLSNSEELKVRQTESVRKMTENMGITDFALLTPSVAGSI
jgi:AraC-like DNA-binding protein